MFSRTDSTGRYEQVLDTLRYWCPWYHFYTKPVRTERRRRRREREAKNEEEGEEEEEIEDEITNEDRLLIQNRYRPEICKSEREN